MQLTIIVHTASPRWRHTSLLKRDCISESKNFIENIKSVQKTMPGLLPTANVDGEGTGEWSFYDDYGFIQYLRVKAYYILSSTVRLFSPQQYLQ